MSTELDLHFVRQHFPGLQQLAGTVGFFDSAAGSLPCLETIEALHEFYLHYKVQPGNNFEPSHTAWQKMAASKTRWAEALGVRCNELGFGPSTSQNIYVLGQAFREVLEAGDQVIVTNQDHEANNGAMRRAAAAAGAEVVEWQVNTATGLLELSDFTELLSAKTKLVCMPHSSNIAGQRNPVEAVIDLCHQQAALVLVDAVSFAPHHLQDISALGADIYLFSLYKVFSVHLGLMVIRESVMEILPKQGHFFKSSLDVNERFVPAGPDHGQIAAAAAVLDYIETLSAYHGGPVNDLRQACEFVSSLWYQHEQRLTKPLIELLAAKTDIKLIGEQEMTATKCPLIAFAVLHESAEDLVHILNDQGVCVTWGHFYAPRLLTAMGFDPDQGVVRISMAHYNTETEVMALCHKLDELLQ